MDRKRYQTGRHLNVFYVNDEADWMGLDYTLAQLERFIEALHCDAYNCTFIWVFCQILSVCELAGRLGRHQTQLL
jgi:hypothetical protein